MLKGLTTTTENLRISVEICMEMNSSVSFVARRLDLLDL